MADLEYPGSRLPLNYFYNFFFLKCSYKLTISFNQHYIEKETGFFLADTANKLSSFRHRCAKKTSDDDIDTDIDTDTDTDTDIDIDTDAW
jgi:hypothetical protein